MDNEQRVWAFITVVCFTAILVLVASEYGFSFDLIKESNTGTNDSSQETELSSTADNPDPIALECLDHSGLARHDHSNLKIYLDGQQRLIPSMIGIDSEICNGDTENMHAVHTHDSTGKLHIESNTDIDIPIGVFFDIWGVHFNETGIFEYRVNETYELVMTIDGVLTTEYDDYLLVNGKEIVISYQQRAS